MSFYQTLVAFAAYAAEVNLTGFIAMVWDKESAGNGKWRVPERLLLALALVGGSIGVIAGRRVWRHKTRKEPFRSYLRMIVIIQFMILISLAFPDVRSALWAFLGQTPG